MTPRSEKDIQEIKQQRRAQILDSALDLFAMQGYFATSIQLVAKKAGISKGLIYNYFQSKEDLLEAVFVRFFGELESEFDSFWNQIGPNALEQFIEISVRTAIEHKEKWRMYIGLFLQPAIPSSIRENINQHFRNALGKLEHYLQLSGLNEAHAHAWLLGASMDGMFLYYLIDENHCPLEKMKTILIDRYKSIAGPDRRSG